MKTAALGPGPAKIGTYYRVPCLLMPFGFCGTKWVPIIGPKHRDLELGADFEHLHIDWRFAPDRMFRECSKGRTGEPHGNAISNDNPAGAWLSEHSLTGVPELKLRKCRRGMPDFPVGPGPKWAAMELAQRARGCRLRDGHICPHRGIDLRPFEQPDGTAICPGHGLKFDMRTGLLMARHAHWPTEPAVPIAHQD